MDHTHYPATVARPNELPLIPEPTASLECLLYRLDGIHGRLLRRGFSDAVVSRAIDEVLRVGGKALESGKAAGMSNAQRAGWLWQVALSAARRAARKEPACVSLTYDPPAKHRRFFADEARFTILHQEIDRLPERQRQAVKFRGLEGLSLREAARVMGVSASTVAGDFKAACAELACSLALWNRAQLDSEE